MDVNLINRQQVYLLNILTVLFTYYLPNKSFPGGSHAFFYRYSNKFSIFDKCLKNISDGI